MIKFSSHHPAFCRPSIYAPVVREILVLVSSAIDGQDYKRATSICQVAKIFVDKLSVGVLLDADAVSLTEAAL